MIVRKTGISQKQLYYWEKLGIIQPRFAVFGMRSFRQYSEADVEMIFRVVKYLKEGYHLRGAAKKAKEDFLKNKHKSHNKNKEVAEQ